MKNIVKFLLVATVAMSVTFAFAQGDTKMEKKTEKTTTTKGKDGKMKKEKMEKKEKTEKKTDK